MLQALYRVDRNWPQLPDWLVRAFSLQKRQAKGYKGGDSGPEAEASGMSTGTAGSSSSSSSEKGPLPEAEKLAKEVFFFAERYWHAFVRAPFSVHIHVLILSLSLVPPPRTHARV